MLAAAGASTAHAAGTEIGVADDRILLAGGVGADRVVAEWRDQGVDVVRIFALWSRIAPAQRASRPRPAASPPPTRTPPATSGAGSTQAVARVRAAGIRVMLTVSGPGPLWSSRSPGRRNPRYKPVPAKFADFATAVARRYGAGVDRYIVWNEPNLPSWLQPQAACVHRRCTPVAPHLYRALVRAAYPAIKAADPGAQVLIGAMSSRGVDLRARNSTLRPLVFVRALGCVSSRFRRLRTGDCRGFKPARADGFSFHPHGTLISPDSAYRNRDDVNLGSLGRLEAGLDRLQRAGRLRAQHAPLQPLPRRVRLPDAAARPHRRRLARERRTAGCSAPPTGRGATGVCGCSPSTSGTTSRCAAPVPLCRLAVGPALPEREAEAGARALRHADGARCGAQPPVGPGAPRRERRP